MDLAKYVAELREIANRFADDDPKKKAANQAADASEAVYNAVNGIALASAYLALPVLVTSVASIVKAHKGKLTDADEKDWFGAVHDTLEDVIDDLHLMLFADELKAHLAGSLTSEQVDRVLADVPDDEKGN